MNKNKIIFLALIIAISNICIVNSENLFPVIGIYTLPSEYQQYPPTLYQYIAASYVKFIEMAGARVIPIRVDSSQQTLDHLLSQINGLLFTGGDADINPANQYTQNAYYLFEKIIEMNQKGIHFPIWGTCLGFQLLNALVVNMNPAVLTTLNPADRNLSHTIQLTTTIGNLYKNVPPNLLSYVENQEALYYNHQMCVVDATYKTYPVLDAFFYRTAHSISSGGVKFIASVEARSYPIFGTQYHAEKNNFEWKVNASHTEPACQYTQSIADYFVQQARLNNQTFVSQQELQNLIIWNWPVVQLQDSSFSQIYIINNTNNTGEIKA